MMNKTLLFAVGFMFALPGLSLAASYHYIDIQGNVQTIEANSGAEALATVALRADALHSGVVLDQGVLEEGDDYGIVYAYMSTSGETRTVTAATLDAAYLLAPDAVVGTVRPVAIERGAEVNVDVL